MEQVTYYKPKGLAEFVELMKTHRKDTSIIAGGTNLIPEMRDGVKSPKVLLDVGALESLSGIELDADGVSIGAAATMTEISQSAVVKEHIPILAKAASEIGNVLTRNRATIGGNLANASPCADTAPPLLALEAMIHITDAGGVARVVPVDKFFLGYKLTHLVPGDVMTRISIPLPQAGARGGHTKLGLRKSASICVASVALTLMRENDHIAKARIAFGSVAPQPIRAYNLEEYLEGKSVNDKVLAECERILKKEIVPISDIRGTAGYRQAAAGAILKRNLVQAWS
jgi:aerobic carbon-monoxide dehydrogenase medium subunit